MKASKVLMALLLVALWLAVPRLADRASGQAPAAVSGADEKSLADWIVRTAGVKRGVCAVVGCRNSQLALHLAQASELLVHVQDPDPAAVEGLRQAADAAGFLGTRLIVEKGPISELPYADNVVDLAVVYTPAVRRIQDVSWKELTRVLSPGRAALVLTSSAPRTAGIAGTDTAVLQEVVDRARASGVTVNGFRSWAKLDKAFPAGIDAWSHWQHEPDNNPVSTDTVIRPPYITQYLATPWYSTMPSISVICNGIMFRAAGHMAIHAREERYLNTLYATNAYNGTVLWTRPIPEGFLVHRSLFVATPDTLYLLEPRRCLMLEPQTGRQKDEIVLPPETSGGGYWQWIALDHETLYALLGSKDFDAEVIKRNRQTGAWGWNELSKGYYEAKYPWAYGSVLVALDPKTKQIMWRREEPSPIDSRALCIGGGKVFVHSEGRFVEALDKKSGRILWRNEDPKLLDAISEPNDRGLGFKTTPYAICTDQALFFGGRGRKNVVAVSAADGRFLWQIPGAYNATNLVFYEGRLLAHIPSLTMLDPLTGQGVRDLGIGKRSCARMTGCPGSLFHRGSLVEPGGGAGEGTIRYDLGLGRPTVIHAFRPPCNDGIIPAQGMLYHTQWDCDCNLQLMGGIALAPAGNFEFGREASEAERLEVVNPVGAAGPVGPAPPVPPDWHTYRGDNSRSSFTPVKVPKTVVLRWEYQPERPYAPSPPTAADGMMFVSGQDGKVRALDAATGKERWVFYAAGPVRLPPSYYGGLAYVGSGDGYVYCLKADSGQLVWRFRAAPVERRIMVYGSLCSTWPVNSGVLVENGVAYAAAGIINYDGTHVYALDAYTGKIRWQNNTSGHLNQEMRCGVSAQGDLTILDGKLWLAGGNVVSPGGYNLSDGKCINAPPGPGWPAASRGSEVCALMGKYVAVGGRRMFTQDDDIISNWQPFEVVKVEDGGTRLSQRLPASRVAPAFGNGAVVLCPRGPLVCASYEAVEQWLPTTDKNAPLQIRWRAASVQNAVAAAIASDTVLAVGELSEPGASSTWSLQALDIANGTPLWNQALPAAPLPGGLCVDRNGQVIVVLEDGRVMCFGEGK